jgi:hypothetical protein
MRHCRTLIIVVPDTQDEGYAGGDLRSRHPAHPTRSGAQALRLRHPARLDLRRQGGQPAPAPPRQNSGITDLIPSGSVGLIPLDRSEAWAARPLVLRVCKVQPSLREGEQ